MCLAQKQVKCKRNIGFIEDKYINQVIVHLKHIDLISTIIEIMVLL